MTKKKQNKDKKYITLADTNKIDFRTISKISTSLGYKCNHATARNELHRALFKLAEHILDYYNEKPTTEKIKSIVGNVNFQEGIQEVLEQAYMKDPDSMFVGYNKGKVMEAIAKYRK